MQSAVFLRTTQVITMMCSRQYTFHILHTHCATSHRVGVLGGVQEGDGVVRGRRGKWLESFYKQRQMTVQD